MSQWGLRILVVLGLALGVTGLGLMVVGLLLWLIPIALVVWWASEVLGTLRRIERSLRNSHAKGDIDGTHDVTRSIS